MPSYAVTGASRGLGYEFVKQLSAKPENVVFAIVRNKGTATKLNALSAKNLHVLQADIVDHAALKAAAAKISEITGGKLDVLINNAALVEPDHGSIPLNGFDGKEEVLEKDLRDSFDVNVIGVIHTINAMLPLLQRGSMKKVITLSTGIAEPEFLEKTGIFFIGPYSISKVATNMVVTKYSIQFKEEGFVFVALSPGFVNTMERQPTEKDMEAYNGIVGLFRRAKPSFEGAITPEESVKIQLRLIENFTTKDNGSFVSHHGNKDWL